MKKLRLVLLALVAMIGTGAWAQTVYDATLLTRAQVLAMGNGTNKTVVIANPHKNNGYFFGFDGAQNVSTLFGATMAAGQQSAQTVANNENYRLTLSKTNDGKYVISKGTGAAAMYLNVSNNKPAWSGDSYDWTINESVNLTSTSDMAANYSNDNLVRISTNGSQWMNSQGNIANWLINGGTGEWTVWCVYEVVEAQNKTYTCHVNGCADGKVVYMGDEYANGQTFTAKNIDQALLSAKAVAGYHSSVSVSGTDITATYAAWPFTLTTDAGNPVLYAIQSARGDYYFTKTSEGKIHLNARDTEDINQKWFFMEDPQKTGYINIIPAAESGKLAASSTFSTDGAGKIDIVSNQATYNYGRSWTVEDAGDGWYAFRLYNTNINPNALTAKYLSNWGGTGNDMGIYGSVDAGTKVKFVSVSSEPIWTIATVPSDMGGITLTNGSVVKVNGESFEFNGTPAENTDFTVNEVTGYTSSVVVANNTITVTYTVIPPTVYTVTYSYKYNGTQFDSQEYQVEDGGAYPAPKQFEFSTALATPAGTVSATETVEFNVDFVNFPFEVAADYASINKWYNIEMRNNRYAYYDEGNETTETPTATTLGNEDTFRWAFVGTPASFKIVNKAAGSTKAMQLVGELKNVFSATADATNYVAVEAAAQEGRNVYIKVEGNNNQYINLRDNTKMAYWFSANAKGEVGSALGITEVVLPDWTVVTVPETIGGITLADGTTVKVNGETFKFDGTPVVDTDFTVNAVTDYTGVAEVADYTVTVTYTLSSKDAVLKPVMDNVAAVIAANQGIPGQQSAEAKATLQTAWDAANTVYTDDNATVAEINAAATALQTALDTYNASTDIAMPVEGQVYFLNLRNGSDDATSREEYNLYDNNDNTPLKRSETANGANPQYVGGSAFVATNTTGNKYVFRSAYGRYLMTGTGTTGTSVVNMSATYNANTAEQTVNKIVSGGYVTKQNLADLTYIKNANSGNRVIVYSQSDGSASGANAPFFNGSYTSGIAFAPATGYTAYRVEFVCDDAEAIATANAQWNGITINNGDVAPYFVTNGTIETENVTVPEIIGYTAIKSIEGNVLTITYASTAIPAKVIQFVTPGRDNKAMAEDYDNLQGENYRGKGKTADNTDAEQLWLLENVIGQEYFTLRNLNTGRYLNPVEGTSAKWYTVKSNPAPLYKSTTSIEGEYTLGFTNDIANANNMHLDGQNVIVGWYANGGETQNAASKWLFNEVADGSAYKVYDLVVTGLDNNDAPTVTATGSVGTRALNNGEAFFFPAETEVTAANFEGSEVTDYTTQITIDGTTVRVNYALARATYTVRIKGDVTGAATATIFEGTASEIVCTDGDTYTGAVITADDVTPSFVENYNSTVSIDGLNINVTYFLNNGGLLDDNNRVYTISAPRGQLHFNGTRINGVNETFTAINGEFAVIKSENDNYYLYSVGAGKFVSKDGNLVSDLPVNQTVVNANTGGTKSDTYPQYLTMGDFYYNINPQGALVINDWRTLDDGNQFRFVDAGARDLSSVVALVNAYETNTYTVSSNRADGGLILNDGTTVKRSGETFQTTDDPAYQGAVELQGYHATVSRSGMTFFVIYVEDINFDDKTITKIGDEIDDLSFIVPTEWYLIKQSWGSSGSAAHQFGETQIYDNNGTVKRTGNSDNDVKVGDVANDKKDYLVRLIPSEEFPTTGIFRIQFANGKYVAKNLSATDGTVVRTTATEADAANFILAKEEEPEDGWLGTTVLCQTPDGVTYGQRLDNEGKGQNVIFRGTGAGTGSYDDMFSVWAIYPVSMTEDNDARIDLEMACQNAKSRFTDSQTPGMIGIRVGQYDPEVTTPERITALRNAYDAGYAVLLDPTSGKAELDAARATIETAYAAHGSVNLPLGHRYYRIRSHFDNPGVIGSLLYVADGETMVKWAQDHPRKYADVVWQVIPTDEPGHYKLYSVNAKKCIADQPRNHTNTGVDNNNYGYELVYMSNRCFAFMSSTGRGLYAGNYSYDGHSAHGDLQADLPPHVNGGNSWTLEEIERIPLTSVLRGTFASEYPLNFQDEAYNNGFSIRAYVCTGTDDWARNLTMQRVQKTDSITGFYIAGDEAGTFTYELYDGHDGDRTEIQGDNYLVPVLFNDLPAGSKTVHLDEQTPYEGGTYYNYILQNQPDKGLKFYKVKAEGGNTIAANRAYLHLDKAICEKHESNDTNIGGNGEAKEYWSVEDDEATSISDALVNSQRSTVNGTYDLSGRKVGADAKGIVIVNGKKVFNK